MITFDYPIVNNILLFQKGPFSQWYGAYKGQKHKLEIPYKDFPNWYHYYSVSDFVNTDGNISFNCAEQAMMFYKALFFNDKETSEKILKETNPRYQKDLGRLVRNYNDIKWSNHRFEAIRMINKYKFKDNSDLKEFLISTNHLILAEASPWDRIWGIGLAPDDKRAHDVSTWQGKNLLGRVLMSVREDFNRE
jgi:ribA/ribD-fused uncharacterized protein